MNALSAALLPPVTALDMHCKKFFRVISLFFGAVTSTTWTIGHAVPVHTAQIFAKFGLGLGLNTMQGREAKHQTILHYCANAMSNQHWETAFRHEFISLLWLPANDPSSYKYKQTKFLWKPVWLSSQPSVAVEDQKLGLRNALCAAALCSDSSSNQ